MHPITRKRNWSEIEHASRSFDWTVLCPCKVGRVNEAALAHVGSRTILAMQDHPASNEDAREAASRLFQMATDSTRQRRTRGVALVSPRHRFVSQASLTAVVLGWAIDQRERLHIRVVRREVSAGWFISSSSLRFGMASWPDLDWFANTHSAIHTRNDYWVWTTLYPELVPPYPPKGIRNPELFRAVSAEPGNPLNWDALADSVEEQGYNPTVVRLGSRLLREMILRGGIKVMPRMLPHS